MAEDRAYQLPPDDVFYRVMMDIRLRRKKWKPLHLDDDLCIWRKRNWVCIVSYTTGAEFYRQMGGRNE